MILYGTLRDQSRIETDGRISIQAQYTRESDVYPGELITREIRNEPIIDGAFRVENLEAGPVIVEITAGAEFSRWELVLPEGDGEHNLADLVDAYVEWEPPIVAAAQAAAAEAQAAAAVVGGAEAVMSAKSEAEAAASSSASSATNAASSATNAAGSASAAAQSAQDAEQSAAAASTSATNAKTSAGEAATSEDTSLDAAAAAIAAAVSVAQFQGHGSPNGVVAAPVGSIYTDLAATNGAIRWIKTSGTENTGWKVEYGDTARILLYHGTGDPVLSNFPDARVGDVIERTSDGARWGVEE